jgi:hypothetical protein
MQAAPPDKSSDTPTEIMPGAKQVGRFTLPSLRTDHLILVDTADGPRFAGVLVTEKRAPLSTELSRTLEAVVWDGANGKPIAELPGRQIKFTFRLGSPVAILDGKILSGVQTMACVPRLSPSGKRLAIVYNWQVDTPGQGPTEQTETIVSDVKTRKQVMAGHTVLPIEEFLFNSKGALHLIDEEKYRVLKEDESKISAEVKSGKSGLGDGPIQAAALSPDDTRLAVFSATGKLNVYDIAEGKLQALAAIDVKRDDNTVQLVALLDPIQKMSFAKSSTDPKLLLLADGKLRLIDLKAKKEVKSLKAEGLVHAFFASDDEPRVLVSQAASGKMKFKCLDMSGKLLHEFTLQNGGDAGSDPHCLLSSNGRYLATFTTTLADERKGQETVTLWDLEKVK